MSDSQLETLNIALFQSRVELDKNKTQLAATEKVYTERVLELGRLNIQLEVLKTSLSNLQTEYSNVVGQAEKVQSELVKKIDAQISEHSAEVDNLNTRIAELQKEILDAPETPSEKLVEIALSMALSRLHSVVLYLAASTLSTNRQSHAAKAFDKVRRERFDGRWARLFYQLSVKEIQVVRENIRAYVQSELKHCWEYEAIRSVILSMQESPVSWKTFQEYAAENSKSLIDLVSNTEQFDAASNAVVEFILEQLK